MSKLSIGDVLALVYLGIISCFTMVLQGDIVDLLVERLAELVRLLRPLVDIDRLYIALSMSCNSIRIMSFFSEYKCSWHFL